MDRIPATSVHARISRRMRDVENQKVRIRTPPYKTPAQISSPPVSSVGEQRVNAVARQAVEQADLDDVGACQVEVADDGDNIIRFDCVNSSYFLQ